MFKAFCPLRELFLNHRKQSGFYNFLLTNEVYVRSVVSPCVPENNCKNWSQFLLMASLLLICSSVIND